MQAPPEQKLWVGYDRSYFVKIIPILVVMIVVSAGVLYFAFTTPWAATSGRRNLLKLLMVVACVAMLILAPVLFLSMQSKIKGRKAALEGDSEGLTIGFGAGKPVRYRWNEIESIYLHSGPQNVVNLCIKPFETVYQAKTTWFQRVLEGLSVMGTGAPYSLGPQVMDRPWEEIKDFIERYRPIS